MNRGVFNDRASNATGQAVAQDADSRGALDGVPVSDSTQCIRCSEWLSLVDKTSCLRLKKKTAAVQY